MAVVAERYAGALFDLAVAGNAVDEYRRELEMVSKIYEAESGLSAFLQDPRKSLTVKKELFIQAFDGSVRRNILHLLLLLLDKGRMESLPDICTAYAGMADEYRNILNITVTTALPLTQAQIDSIGEKFKAVYHASSVKMIVGTDRSLIGGVKVAIGDRLYDSTVKGKLLKMKSALAGQ